jgi:hypothetical protein
MDPQLLPEFVHDLAVWTRSTAPELWAAKSAQGCPFYWPPELRHNPGQLLGLRNAVYDDTLRRTGNHHIAHAATMGAHQDASLESFAQLADYYASTLERAHLLCVGKDISYLAAKTEMKDFRLELDLFRPSPGEGPKSCGFVTWDTPIGAAEARGAIRAYYEHGVEAPDSVEFIEDMMSEFKDAETPVNAASWRILPGGKEVLVTFYSDGVKAAEVYRAWMEGTRKNLPPGQMIDEHGAKLQLSDPQPLEREQVLPLGETLAWFHEKEKPNRLTPTIVADPTYLRAAERAHVADKYNEANEAILPMLSQMVKTFVATLAIRRMKLASREEVAAPRASVKRMRRSGASSDRQESRVEVVRIGKAMQRRGKGGSGGGKWKVKTVVGPVIRTRQYVPAHDEYRDGFWEIEPYVAGPLDAPWSDKARVFLLD